MPKINKYHCEKCGTKLKRSDVRCPKCKSYLVNDRAFVTEKFHISDIKKAKKKEGPTFVQRLVKKWWFWYILVTGSYTIYRFSILYARREPYLSVKLLAAIAAILILGMFILIIITCITTWRKASRGEELMPRDKKKK